VLILFFSEQEKVLNCAKLTPLNWNLPGTKGNNHFLNSVNGDLTEVLANAPIRVFDIYNNDFTLGLLKALFAT
jgi:hypothetical protein